MKAFKIEGFKDVILFCLFVLFSLSIIIGVPSLITWVAWNGVIGDLLDGPYIAFWQAILLTLAVLLTIYQLMRPEIIFEVHHVEDNGADDKLTESQKRIKKLKNKKQDS